MRILLPWSIQRLPSGVPLLLTLTFLLSALLKLFGPGYLCGPNPWQGANTSMIPLEFGLAWLFWVKSRREFGALLGCAAMLGAAGLLTWAHLTGRDVRTCGCFGPIEMSYGGHMAVTGALFSLCFLTLISADATGRGSAAAG